MARRFNFYKYKYTRDNGTEVIRTQREYKDKNNQVIIPVTQLFVDRVISGDSKTVVDKLDAKQRRVEVTLILDNKESVFKQYIPYDPSDIAIRNHVKEIRDSVINKFGSFCGDYFGEESSVINELN